MLKIAGILSFFLISLSILHSEEVENDVPEQSVTGQYIKEWLILGPFFPNDLKKDFLTGSGGEANISPFEGDKVFTADGDTLVWKRYRTDRKAVDLLDAIGKYEQTTAYAFRIINSDIEETNRILVGSDDGVAIWINGKLVHLNDVPRPLFLDNDNIGINLRKGANRCLVKISQGTGRWNFAFRRVSSEQPVSIAPKFFIDSNHMENGLWLQNSQWKYHPGDNGDWAKPEFDDSSWELVNPELIPGELPESGWEGTGWFRLHITVDSTLTDTPLGLFIWQAGSSRIYLDGKLIYTFGEKSGDWIKIPKTLIFTGKEEHLIAVRYSNPSFNKFNDSGSSAGFAIRLGKMDWMVEDSFQREKAFTGIQMFLTSLSLAIGLFHLILFAFFPDLKQNLYFALYLFAYAATIFSDYQILLSKDIGQHLFSMRLHCAILPFWVLLQLRFVYSLFYDKLPKQFLIITPVTLFLGALVFRDPIGIFSLSAYINSAVNIEIGRVIILALIKKREGAWIIGIAFLLFYFFGTMDTLMDKGYIDTFRRLENPYAFGIIGLFIAMTVYLSRDYAFTHKKIARQEFERKILEAENDRQAKELEEARQLQLSMLPEKLPRNSDVGIGAYMKTATEVGGDYYDFKEHSDGTLTIVIGDATGHGTQAGTMVSATKSLFLALADEPDPVQFLRKVTKAIKQMGLRKMFMALTIAKLKDRKMLISAAGMPFALIYRSSTRLVEEIVLKGMPMGSVDNFPYQSKSVDLNKGDTVLFKSDGFEEMFNPQNETLGEEKVKKLFGETADKSPEEIIRHLTKAGEEWANGRRQEDDVTFVIIKIRQHS